jgi:uncharacterized membrane protein
LNSLVVVTCLSLLLLFFSFMLLFSKVYNKTLAKFISLMVVFLCMSFPVLYTVTRELSATITTANYGLSLSIAFLFTWVLTAIIFLISIVFHYKAQKQDDYSMF